MKNRFLIFFVLVFLQFPLIVNAAKIKDQATLDKEIELVSDLYLKGNYYEALSNIENVFTKLKGKDSLFAFQKVQLNLLASQCHYATLNFTESEKIVQQLTLDVEKLSLNNEKSIAKHLLVQYYIQTNQLALADVYLDKAKKTWEASNFYKLNFLNNELSLLNAHKKYRLAQLKLVEIDTLLNEFKRDNVNIIKKDLATYYTLKAEYLVDNEFYDEAEKHFNLYKKWFPKNVDVKYGHLSRFLESEANMYWKRKEYIKANDLYKLAYAALESDDYAIKRIDLLSRLTYNSVYLDDLISYQKHMRRLLLHADRNINKFNNFQMAVIYNLAFQDLTQKNYSSALKRLEKFNSKGFEMPLNHSFNFLKMSLLAEIYRQDYKIENEITVLDSISTIYGLYFGEKSPATVHANLKSIHEKTSLGLELAKNETYLKTNIRELLSSSLDSNRVLFLQLETELAEIFFHLDKFNLAYDEALVANSISSKIYNSKSWEQASYFMNYNIKASWSGNYKEALLNYLTLEEKNKVMKNFKTDGVYLKFCNQYAQLASLLGDFDLAKRYSLLAEKTLEATSYDAEIYLLDIPEQASVFYIENSSLFEAEKILTKSLSFKRSKLGQDHPSLLSTYKSLVKLYIDNGNYALADKMIEAYLNLSMKIYGVNSLLYSEGIALKGEYAYSIGSFIKAKEAFESELKLKTAIISTNNIELVSCYLNLAKIHSLLYPKQVVENEKLFNKAGFTINNAIGKQNVLYANYLHTTAEFYVSVKQYDRAIAFLKEEESFWVSRLSKNNSHVADIYMLYAQISYNKNEYKESEKQYVEAQSIYESVFGNAHLSYTYATSRLAKVHYMLKQPDKALTLMENCLPQYLLYVEKYFPNLSFQEKSKFWFKIKDEFEFYNFLILSSEDSKNKSIGNVYNNILSTKAILLSSDVKLRKQISQSGDTLLISLFDQWLIQKELLASSVSKSKEQLAEENLSVSQIELSVERLEKEMSERSSAFQTQSKKAITWKEVQDQLTENEFAVEILKFRYFDKVFTDSVIYAGLIVSGQGKGTPEKVIFKDGNKMDNMYYAYYQNMTKLKGNDTYSYNVYWKPLKDKIPNGATIYFSADGVYTQLNVETFKNSTNQFALDENQFVYVSNTKDIIPVVKSKQKKKSEIQNDLYVTCGNPSFYSNTFNGRQFISPLPGSEKEVIQIDALLNKNNKNHKLLLNEKVTEDTLFSFQNIRSLHIATHGYFKEEDKLLEASVESNPLLNSGLLLYGAGDILASDNYVNIKSGVLTAFEVVNMHLDNTELVVLSACETGKGQVQSGEGVFGLQRSFLVAGANCIIISLFKVNDAVTQDLMISFYSNWLQSNDKRASFVKAKKEIKEKYPDPIDWGSFIMIEGIKDQETTL